MNSHLNLPCTIEARIENNVYGEIVFATAKHEKCAVVELKKEVSSTSVRADSSATRGYAEEFVSSNLVLLDSSTIARPEDRLVVFGFSIRIKSLFPRHDVFGKLDHYEVMGETWE